MKWQNKKLIHFSKNVVHKYMPSLLELADWVYPEPLPVPCGATCISLIRDIYEQILSVFQCFDNNSTFLWTCTQLLLKKIFISFSKEHKNTLAVWSISAILMSRVWEQLHQADIDLIHICILASDWSRRTAIHGSKFRANDSKPYK
jgi:hypothetical protein